ncbi:MAG: HemK/PrmC family methyltransferase [bacterium]|nr:HemK/PrmC family methyltransferase [bacterium]
MARDEQQLLEEKYGGKKTPSYEADRKRLAGGEPLAYVIGWQPFLGLKIHLDSKPLIPRPETEWWTEQLLLHLDLYSKPPSGNHASKLKFLDLCAGSGAIGCAILKALPYTEVFFGEIDATHEATIQKNIRENNLDASRADIRIGDLFGPFEKMTFDVIVANPPYVPVNRALPASVADHEPGLALFAGEDGLDIIRRIAIELPKHLTKNGIAWIECDREHAEASRSLFIARGFAAEIRNDQYDKPRIIVVRPIKNRTDGAVL